MSSARFAPVGPLRGSLRPPSDKSISHRAALIAAMGEGKTSIDGYLDAADTRSSLAAVEKVGARVVVGSQRMTMVDSLGWKQLPSSTTVAPSLGLEIHGVGL